MEAGVSGDKPLKSEEPIEKVEKPANQIPIVDPSDAESRGAAPQKFKDHFVWSLKSDTMILIYKMMATFAVGMSLFWIATIHIYIYFALSVVFPAILFIVNQFFYRGLFHDDFTASIIIPIKYLTFVFQNLLAFCAFWWGTDAMVAEIATWALRLNILEVSIAAGVQRIYVYWIPSLLLLGPLCGWTNMFVNCPRLGMVAHDHYFIVWETWDPWFIIVYTLWFVGWIVRSSERLPMVLHTIFPLFAPPQLWFTIRTFCGMFLLWWTYLPATRFLIYVPHSVPQVADFSEIYDAIFVMVFLAAYVMPFLMEYIKFE